MKILCCFITSLQKQRVKFTYLETTYISTYKHRIETCIQNIYMHIPITYRIALAPLNALTIYLDLFYATFPYEFKLFFNVCPLKYFYASQNLLQSVRKSCL